MSRKGTWTVGHTIGAALAIVASCAAIAPVAAAAAEGTGTISGTVVEAASGKAGIEGLCVQAHPAHLGEPKEDIAVTGAGGRYTIEEVPAGPYKIGFEQCPYGNRSLNFAPRFYPEAKTYDEATYVDLAGGEARTGIDAEMRAGGEIHGQLVDEHEGPIADICATAFPTEVSGYATGQTTTTNANGEYTISGLGGGNYTVQYAGCGQNYVPAYLDEAASASPNFRTSATSEATHIAVTAEQTPVVPVDVARARLQVGAVIEGSVTEADGGALVAKEICVAAMSRDAPFGLDSYRYGASVDGHYRIETLATGSYTLRFDDACEGREEFAMQYYADASTESSATPISLTAGIEPPTPFIANVELTRIGGPAPPASTPPSGAPKAPSLQAPLPNPVALRQLARVARTARVNANLRVKSIPVKLTCRGLAAGCEGSLQLVYEARAKTGRHAKGTVDVKLGVARFAIAAGRVDTVAVKLTRVGADYVAKAPHGRLRVRATGEGVEPRSLEITMIRNKPREGR